MLGALTTKLSILTIFGYYKFINGLRQQKLVNVIYAYNLPMLSALTTNSYVLLTLGAHAQRGLRYLLCVCVCVCVC